MTIADYYYDFLVPSLRTGGIGPDDVKLLGSDGTPKAYNRVRSGNYQVMTVPEPAILQGYQAVDALNRAFQGEKPVDFQQPVYLVVKQNVDKEGGDKNVFDPSSNYRERYLKIWKPE
jgi:ribose transport system substrate-binding protein